MKTSAFHQSHIPRPWNRVFSASSIREHRKAGQRRPFAWLGIAMILLVAAMIASPAHGQTQQLVTYFNFNDSNEISDLPGVQPSTITKQNLNFSFIPGTTVNLATGDTTGAGSALHLTFASGGGGGSAKSIQFTVNTLNLSNLSLSYATQASAGGHSQAFSYSTNGTTFINVGTFTPTTTWTTATFNLPSSADYQPSVTFRITLTGSGGNDVQYSDFDNIQPQAKPDPTPVPEPATVGAGLLGVFGLCWHQRRRLLRAAQSLRRAAA